MARLFRIFATRTERRDRAKGKYRAKRLILGRSRLVGLQPVRVRLACCGMGRPFHLARLALPHVPGDPAGAPGSGDLRRGAEEMFTRAEDARDQGNLEDAARWFGRAAGTWRTTGDVLEAADAYLELGAVLLRQGRGKLLPELAARLLRLLEIKPLETKPLPEGAALNLRVFAALVAKGNENREAFLGLVQERRLGRHRRRAPG